MAASLSGRPPSASMSTEGTAAEVSGRAADGAAGLPDAGEAVPGGFFASFAPALEAAAGGDFFAADFFMLDFDDAFDGSFAMCQKSTRGQAFNERLRRGHPTYIQCAGVFSH